MKILFNEAPKEYIEANININNYSFGALPITEKEIEVEKLTITHLDGMKSKLIINNQNVKVYFIVNEQKYFTSISYTEFINDFLIHINPFELVEKESNSLTAENLKIGTIYKYRNSNYLLYLGKHTLYNTNEINEFYGSYQKVLTTKDVFIPLGSDISILDLYNKDDLVSLEKYYNDLWNYSYGNPKKLMGVFLTDYTKDIHLLKETSTKLNVKSLINTINLFSNLLLMMYEKTVRYLMIDSYLYSSKKFLKANTIKDMLNTQYSVALFNFIDLTNMKQKFKQQHFDDFYHKLDNYYLVQFYLNLGIILGNNTEDELPKTKEEYLDLKKKFTEQYFKNKLKKAFESDLNTQLNRFKKNKELYNKLQKDYKSTIS